MAFIQPDSTITLYSDIQIDNGEQLAFSSVAKQLEYFSQHVVTDNYPCTVVKKTGALRMEIQWNLISTCNYLSFSNPSFDGKIIYARIVDYEYINNECVEISYAIDYWQTWMFDCNYDDSFIEREHLSETDWDKAEDNPYDPTILELRTNESLPIGKDLEKATYTLGTGDDVDGSKIGDLAGIGTTLGVLIKMSNVDFKKQDDAITTQSDKPGYKFAQYLSNLVTNGSQYSFFYLPQPMWDYLATFPNFPPSGSSVIVPSGGRFALASGWTTPSGTLYPFYGSSYRPQCCYIYDGNGGEPYGETAGNFMGTFLSQLTAFSGGDPASVIIDMSLIPNNIVWLGGRLDNGTALTTTSYGIRTAKNLDVVCHKLKRYPYAYARVISPNGDIKELHFEDFINVHDNAEDYGYVSMLLDISDRPVFIVAPLEYKIDGMNDENANILECLYFNQFPTMPYTIDAFNAQVAAIANDTIANRTSQHNYELARKIDLSGETAQGMAAIDVLGGGVMGMISGMVSGNVGKVGSAGLGMLSNSFSTERNLFYDNLSAQASKRADLGAAEALGNPGASEIANQMKLTKAAYACDEYHPSNGIGTTNFTASSFCDIISLCVNLQPEVLEVYDKYFTLYGYNSGRCGLPRVLDFVSNGNTNALHWMTLSNGLEITYVKTMDLHVTHSMQPVADAIRSMFNNGVRFIKGDA